ncbi:restriction endonuclease [Janthinobacterium sp. 35]|uniref:nSTAND3 domain-containing NTPase n=1 Tax=Janthinobacterium sp. 35 TaxID=2035210 RepID=UPI000C609B22|nr:restriction endonuclease [Janthinobacterium sp. 35]PIG26614.1 restriction endonuclease [Janthinobacterium sp. 35]
MSDYDFKTLNDKEFEIFCCDLLGAHLGFRIERFKPGKDLGVDGRFFASDGAEVILQCKHWANTPTAQLIRALKDTENQKIKKLNPSRYILAVSNKLSRSDKKSIALALSPHLLSENDIFGCEDLNDIIKQHAGIERNHYKLWMTTTEVLLNLINNAIVGRSKSELDAIQDRFLRYVKTSNHQLALEKLDQLHAIIITGEPGIGKTTLAGQICLDYAAQGYQFIKMSDDIFEAEAVCDQDSKQIYFFDDFLGRNYLEALNGHEGSKITAFIRRISTSKNKRFVLTSRSTILSQGKFLIDLLRHNKTERNEFEMSIHRLSDLDKAKILYNHVWFSGLQQEYIDIIHENENYLEIVKHKNFNPRLISYVTDPYRLSDILSENYWKFISGSLDNPSEIWAHPFDAQQDDFTRAIIILVSMNGRRINESRLADAYYEYIAFPENNTMKGRRDFYSNMELLTGSFLNRFVDRDGEIQFDLFNPSIGDFIIKRYSKDKSILRLSFISLKTVDSITAFFGLFREMKIRDAVSQEIVCSALKAASNKEYDGYSLGYLLDLSSSTIIKWEDSSIFSPTLRNLCKHVQSNLDSVRLSENLLTLFFWAVINDAIPQADIADYLKDNFGSVTEDGEITACWELIEILSLYDETKEEFRELFSEALRETILDNLSAFVDITEAFSRCDYDESSKATSRLAEIISDKLSELGLPEEFIDASDIAKDYDIKSEMDDYFRNSYIPSHQVNEINYRPSEAKSPDDPIHDLFNRS